MAKKELAKLGPMSTNEKLTAGEGGGGLAKLGPMSTNEKLTAEG